MTLERQEQTKYFTTLDGKKSLTLDQIQRDFKNHLQKEKSLERCRQDNNFLNIAVRMFLMKKRYIAPSNQAEGDVQEIFQSLVASIQEDKPGKISAFTPKEQKTMLKGASDLKRQEEDRAGQTYQESGLE